MAFAPPSPGPDTPDVSAIGWRTHLAALSVLVAVAVGCTWPLFARPASTVYDPATLPARVAVREFLANRPMPGATEPEGPRGWSDLTRSDTLLNVWTLAWGAHAIATAPHRFFHANTLWPTPAALSYSDHQLALVPWFAPTYWLTGNPVLAYQLALLGTMVAGGFAFYLLVARATSRPAAGLVAGILGMLAPFRVDSLRVLVHYAIPYLVLALLGIEALVRGERRVRAALVVAAAMAAQALSNVYMIYATFLGVPAYALGRVLGRDGRAHAALPWLVGAGVLAAGVTIVAHVPYLAHQASGLWPAPTRFGATSPDYDFGLRMTWVRTDWAAGRVLQGVGTWALPLAALGLFHRGPMRRAAVLMTMAGVVVAAGPTLSVPGIKLDGLPWYWLAQVVPGFAQQRHPLVASVVTGVGLVLLTGLGVAVVQRAVARVGGVRAAALVGLSLAATAAALTRLPPPRVLELASGDAVPAVYRWLARHGEGEPLLELPTPLGMNTAYAYFSTYHWLPLANGGYATPPPGHLDRMGVAATLVTAPDKASHLLEHLPVRWVLVHENLLLPGFRSGFRQPQPHLVPVLRDGDRRLFRLVP